MNSLKELAEQFYTIIQREEKERAVKNIEIILNGHHNDVFQAVRKINQTSLNRTDRVTRIIELENNFGVPKTNIL